MPKEIWISANEAAEIVSKNSGRPIIPQYIRDLAQKNKLASRPINGREKEYLRSDVEKIKVKAHGKNRQATQIELPIDEKDAVLHEREKTMDAILKHPSPQIFIETRSSGILDNLPSGTMKRGKFVETYGLNDAQFGKWLEHGLGDDKLEATYYISFPNKKKSACMTPEQLAHNLEVLRKHGKISDSGSA